MSDRCVVEAETFERPPFELSSSTNLGGMGAWTR